VPRLLAAVGCPVGKPCIAPAGERLNFFIRGEGSEYAAVASAAVQDAEALMAYVPRRRAGGCRGPNTGVPQKAEPITTKREKLPDA